MPFLVVIPTRNLTYVTCYFIWTTSIFILFLLLTCLCCVDSSGRGRAFSTFSVPLTLFLLLFFPSFVGKLVVIGVLGGTWCWFCTSDLRFFYLGVFHCAILALGDGRVGWSATSRAVLIHLFGAGARSESWLSLGVDGLLDHLVKVF